MPKRTDIKSILIIGAGPIVIGQACEFDYSGAQACKALREEGYRVILVNSNPATIMTDPDMADVTYIEPITWPMMAKIIEKERPDALLPTMGGQTALNCALDLARNGVLEKFNVEMIGATEEAIDKAEDRGKFKLAMEKIGLSCPLSFVAHTMEQALDGQSKVGFPTLIRPSFTMGGSGGGIAYNKEEFVSICERGFEASPTHELLIEQSVLGWKEYEMEVVRDRADNCIIICSIENFDPMGVHTGDSITVAPAQTLTDKEYQIMRNASLAVLREIGVDTGGSNVQFATNPATGEMIVIEMNPRVSRSSALASKATGFPIAKVAVKLAGGYTLAERLHMSAPICMVVAGLIVGNHGRNFGMSDETREHVDVFWELLDSIFNAVLFLLIGAEIMVIHLPVPVLLLGVFAIAAVLLGRLVSVGVPVTVMRRFRPFDRGTIRILTWGGLRGGISIALALSLPAGPAKDVILPVTYMVVLFSIIVQGLTFRPLLQKLLRG